MTQNQLYYGDNLDILRLYIKDESVDLIYLDPPFNSNRAYNVIFQDKTGKQATAQIQAFEDTWHWVEDTQAAYDEILSGNYPVQLKEMLRAFRDFMGPTDMMAYLTMMAIRLFELHRVLKPTGSLYLHCDPTAGHYLKILLDQIFGIQGFRNEINWKRTPFAGSSKARARQLPKSHDIIFFYTKGKDWIWNPPTMPYTEKYLARFKWKDSQGHYRKTLLKTYSKETLLRLRKEGRLIEPTKPDAKYSYKQYLDESSGTRQIDDIWLDINMINPAARERLGYPTQKPQALLERIIEASSSEDDIILDPFCGCGTTIAAAEKLHRKWIGIDITYLAVALIKKRILEHFPDCKFEIIGEPKSADDAKALFEQSPFQFESWVVSLIGGQPFKSSGGGDTGIDGLLYFQDYEKKYHKIIIEVKGGGYQPKDVRALARVMDREKAALSILIALHKPTAGMKREAATLGKWAMPGIDREYPIMQIVTIDELFEGKLPNLPDTSSTLKRAQHIIRDKKQPELF